MSGPARPVESVWDYPRPPAVVPCERHVRIELAGVRVVDSARALRVLETSHPPTVYVPSGDVRPGVLGPSDQPASHCEFKGAAAYLDALVGGHRRRAVAWSYPNPTPAYRALTGYVAFYPGRVDGAWLDDERVAAQPGDFYGGWITAEIKGPFKGGPGTWGW